MVRAYEYLFYRLYCWQRRIGVSDLASALSALVFLLIVVCWNLLFMLELIELIFRSRVPLIRALSTSEILIAATLLAIPQYFFLVHDRRYRKIAQKFELESNRQRRARGIVVFLYVVFSFLLLVLGSILRGKL